jgi:molybdopterin/thiamine biosynthesis adenylyltransferase
LGLRIKPGFSLHRLESGAVWIGPQIPGESVEITDEAEVVWPICQRLDGTRSREVLVAEVLAELPPGGETTAGDVGEIIDVFIGSGWVLDTAAPVPPELSDREVQRYRRNAEFFSSIDLRPETTGYGLQARLKAARVAVLGLGGVGGAAAASLAGCGVGSLHCVDHDIVELSNLNRQLLFTERDIGRSKVEAGVEHLRSRNSDIAITGTAARLDGADDIMRAVKDCDAFLLCADHPGLPGEEIEQWANTAAYTCGVPWLMTGYSGPKYALACFIPGQTVCFWCLYAQHRQEQRSMGIRVDPEYLVHRDRADNPVIAPTAQIAGHFLAMETVRLLLGMAVPTAGRELHRYVVDYDEQYYLDAQPRPDCPVGCGALMAP